MTQPSSLNKTFDTSLVDAQHSFSSTETNTSGSSGKENIRPQAQSSVGRSISPYKTVPTDQLYEQWASTYDTDGNVLQVVDDVQLRSLLPEFVRLTCNNKDSAAVASGALKILDLGCGTGRNTAKLVQADWDVDVDLVGWDGSKGMLDIARSKCDAVTRNDKPKVELEFGVQDILTVEGVPEVYTDFFDGLISTLVLEHIPADAFFAIVSNVLKRGSYALVTNMHQDLGAVSRAGFKDASGERFKGTSYIHTPDDTIAAAAAAGLELVGEVKEGMVDAELIDGGFVNGVQVAQGTVNERARKYVGTKVWFGMLFKKK